MLTRRAFTRWSLALSSAAVASSGLNSCGKASFSKTRHLSLQSPWINDAEFLGYFVAISEKYYTSEGLDFDYLAGGPEIVSDAVLMSGRANLALTTPDSTINAIINNKADLKIIGAQFQKSPLAIVSLEKNHVLTPKDLVGKRLAVPPANVITIEAFLKINGIKRETVELIPYQYDPAPLLRGEVDATLDFATNVPFTIRQRGGEPTSFLLYDYGYRVFNDTVVAHSSSLEHRRDDLKRWFRASRKGWQSAFSSPGHYVDVFAGSWFKGTGRSVDEEKFAALTQEPLIKAPAGIYSMSEASIAECINSLRATGIMARRDHFDTGIIAEL
jgi:ABC-type nitrate/sulfonate/bicarbonate transport system substrate-binding protein